GALAGWQAGTLTLLMPLSATLGILAVPDVPMALAAVLCMDAGARLLREIDAMSALELAIGLLIGALSHYRFAGVVGVGFIALLCIAQGRTVLRDPRVWLALTIGAMGWLPLLLWNSDHQEAGLRFQLVDRHPWRFQIAGFWFLLIQLLMVTPLLAVAMTRVVMVGTRAGGGSRAQWRYFGLLGAVSTLGIFVLGFFSDAERISFHWPLPGYLALLVAVPMILTRWRKPWRRAAWTVAVLGMLGAYGYYLAVSVPSIRERTAGQKYYPRNFAGWDGLARAVKARLRELPPGTRLLAENFKVGAELGFELRDPGIEVLQAPLNDKHGRAAQLQ
ncbi:glycosyltransferase family 39 protein, partial [Xanthomonas sp. Kuri4-3]